MARQLICTLVFLVATLSGARVCFAQDCSCPPMPTCLGCRLCTPQGCPECSIPVRRRTYVFPTCSSNNPPPAPVDDYEGYSLFVFGDSFADNGNLADVPTGDLDRELVRSWYSPYGNSYGNDDGSFASQPTFTGRYSNYMVQSDFVAKMLGLGMAPRPHKQQGDSCDQNGTTFATAGSGIYSVPQGVPTLSDQLNTFANLISTGIISPGRLAKSVALVAISGNDYDRVGVALPSGFGDVSAFILNVTTAISDSVDRLRALGVPKVLVNNLHPVGCTPAQTKAGNYSGCDATGNTGAVTHNKNLAQLMNGKEGVLVVDLHSAFKGIVDHPDGKGSKYSGHFKHKYQPCCKSIGDGNLCGDTGDDGTGPRDLYKLCDKPKEYFYWDEMHPSQTGWAAVMAEVEDSIKQFVGIAQN